MIKDLVVWYVPSVQIRDDCIKGRILASILQVHDIHELFIEGAASVHEMLQSVSQLGQFIQVKDFEPKNVDLLVISEILMHLDHSRWFDNAKASKLCKNDDIWRFLQDVCIQLLVNRGFEME